MRSNLTQGTVITSIRSQKYKNQSCYGIIISARCDIANNKISKIYYLEAVSLEDWVVSETGFKMITKSTLGNINSQIESILKKANLSWEQVLHVLRASRRSGSSDTESGFWLGLLEFLEHNKSLLFRHTSGRDANSACGVLYGALRNANGK